MDNECYNNNRYSGLHAVTLIGMRDVENGGRSKKQYLIQDSKGPGCDNVPKEPYECDEKTGQNLGS